MKKKPKKPVVVVKKSLKGKINKGLTPDKAKRR